MLLLVPRMVWYILIVNMLLVARNLTDGEVVWRLELHEYGFSVQRCIRGPSDSVLFLLQSPCISAFDAQHGYSMELLP